MQIFSELEQSRQENQYLQQQIEALKSLNYHEKAKSKLLQNELVDMMFQCQATFGFSKDKADEMNDEFN